MVPSTDYGSTFRCGVALKVDSHLLLCISCEPLLCQLIGNDVAADDATGTCQHIGLLPCSGQLIRAYICLALL